MKAQLINLGNGKIVVVKDVEIKEGDYFLFQCTKADETNHWKNGMIQKCKNVIDFEIYDDRGDVEQYSSVCDYECKKVIAGHDSLPAISNIDKVFEMWKLAKDEKEANEFEATDTYKDHWQEKDDGGRIGFLAARKDYYSTEMVMGFGRWCNMNYRILTKNQWIDRKSSGVKNNDELFTDLQLFHLYQLSLIPEVLNIEWDENKNEILKVLI